MNNYINKKDAKVVNFPMSTQKCHMKDKKCDYKTLAIMTLYSNMTPMKDQHESRTYEPYRYVYKNKIIKFTDEIEGGLVTATKNHNEEIIYYIRYENERGREYVSIPEDMLRRLVWIGNGNLIKVYLLIKYLCEDEKRRFNHDEKKITNKYICDEIGLSSSSKNNLQGITEITNTLEECDFIKKRYVKSSETGIKTNIFYSLISYDEWMDKKRKRENERYNRV